MVEIARALLTQAKAMSSTSPRRRLSGREVERLLTVVRQLRARGLGVIFVSHRFDEVFALADRITVLRDGRRVASARASDADRAQLIRWMVGRDVSEEFPPRETAPGAAVARGRAPVLAAAHGRRRFAVRRGEIVGLAGLVGAGRTSTGLALAGALPARGRVRIDGEPRAFRSPAEAIARGVAYVTEDRKGRGVLPMMSAAANVTLASVSALRFRRAAFACAASVPRSPARRATSTSVRRARRSRPARSPAATSRSCCSPAS